MAMADGDGRCNKRLRYILWSCFPYQYPIDTLTEFGYKKTFLQHSAVPGIVTTTKSSISIAGRRLFSFWRPVYFRQNVGLNKNPQGFVREEKL
jgi:hypothetical protein